MFSLFSIHTHDTFTKCPSCYCQCLRNIFYTFKPLLVLIIPVQIFLFLFYESSNPPFFEVQLNEPPLLNHWMSCWILDRIMPFSKFLYYLYQYLPLWSLFLFIWIIKFMNLYLLSTVLYFTKSRMCCAHSKCSINIVSWMRMLLFQHVTHSRYLYFTTGIQRLIWRMQWWEKVGKYE